MALSRGRMRLQAITSGFDSGHASFQNRKESRFLFSSPDSRARLFNTGQLLYHIPQLTLYSFPVTSI